MSKMESMVGAMTVGELCTRAGLSVADFVNAAFNRTGPAASKVAPYPNSTNGAVPRGGLPLDQVLAALSSIGAAAKLEDVRGKTGGTVPQVRAALQKLAGAKKVKITGQRRGTRYTAA
jgi:hypothetical protein